MDIYQIAWLIIIVIFLVVEVATAALTTVWFAIGAALAFLSSLVNAPPYLQVIIFVVSSIALLIGFFPFVKKKLGAKTYDTNVDSLVGKEAVITADIKFNVIGQASVGGVIWSATGTSEDVEIPAGEVVKIERISGNKLIVKRSKKDEAKDSELIN